ncbi:MAG: hypothetical protein V4501_12415 [Pseudomonadota bacterium]
MAMKLGLSSVNVDSLSADIHSSLLYPKSSTIKTGKLAADSTSQILQALYAHAAKHGRTFIASYTAELMPQETKTVGSQSGLTGNALFTPQQKVQPGQQPQQPQEGPRSTRRIK